MGKNAQAKQRQEERGIIESRWVIEGPFLKIRQDTLYIPGHSPQTWNIAVPPGAVAILAIDSQERLILVEQWRRAIGRITLELPAGMLDPQETPLDCAQRELQEETGYRALSLEPWGGCFTSPGMISEYIHLFLARDLVESRLPAEDAEGIDIQTVSLQQAAEMIARGEICDAKTVVGILRYLHHG